MRKDRRDDRLRSEELPETMSNRASCLRWCFAPLCLMLMSFAVFLSSFGTILPANSADVMEPPICTLIDNDFDIDDMMAMPMVFAHTDVAAVIQTEGATRAEFSAAGADAFLNGDLRQVEARTIPVIVGGQQAVDRDLSAYQAWLPFFRAMMTRANGLLPEPPNAWPSDPNYARKIASLVDGCESVSVLLLGPYTSFVKYFPLIEAKVDRIVIMGKMLGDDSAGKGDVTFNCEYDMPSCKLAMSLLHGQPAYFVDIPRLPGCRKKGKRPASHCYSPNLEMVTGSEQGDALVEQGLPGRLRKALLNDLDCRELLPARQDAPLTCSSKSTWEPEAILEAGGSGVLLWDQSAALFFLRPDAFELWYPPDKSVAGGKHYEPVIIDGSHDKTVAFLRELWTNLTNDAVNIR